MCCLSQSSIAQNVLIKNGTLLTITQGVKENTDILISNGKIIKIEKNISPISGTNTIDATGLFVMPGIIDAHSHIALDVVNEATNPVTAEVNVGDGLDPLDINIYRALAGGVTTSHAMHGSANAVGGQWNHKSRRTTYGRSTTDDQVCPWRKSYPCSW
jgi:imidazolonepropionase-like amidohydrolase